MNSTNNPSYFYSLNLVKFICALLIALHHYQMVFNLWFEGRLNFNNGAFYFGFLVEFFFIISGFLMENSIRNKKRSDFWTFIKRKYIRFFPMCFISITVYTVLQWAGVLLTGNFFYDNSISLWNYVTSSLLVSKGCGIYNPLPANNPLWYINILIICYVVFWIVNEIAEKKALSPTPFYLFMIILGLNLHRFELTIGFLDYDCGTGYITFFLGAILRRAITKNKAFTKKISLISGILIALILIAFKRTDYWPVIRDTQQYFLIFSVYPWLLCLFATTDWINKICNKALFKKLGEISFEMYLWHFPLLSFIYLLTSLVHYNINHGYKSMLVYLIILFILSFFILNYLEKPINKKINAYINKSNEQK